MSNFNTLTHPALEKAIEKQITECMERDDWII
jgi:hypothetical protein